MSFEEEFPSIEQVFLENEREMFNMGVPRLADRGDTATLPILTVREFCLDKQRVKEAIEKYLTCEHEQTHIAEDCEVCQLKKELGLE